MGKLLEKLGIRTKEDFWAFVKQFFKFGIVGLSNTVIALGVYYVFVFINKDWYLAGNIVGYLLGVVNSYYWNNKYVFQKSESGNLKPMLKFLAVYGVTFVISNLLLYALVDLLGVSEMLAPILNMAVTIPINFLLSKFWAFK